MMPAAADDNYLANDNYPAEEGGKAVSQTRVPPA